MKITSMTLENITSFRGKHTINFKEIAKQSDLFAITGPTGAGKSTLLNAMAMAIYSNNVKGLNTSDLVTTGAPSGTIKLELDIFGDHYRIEWSCQVLKKDGSPRAKPTSNTITYKNGKTFEGSVRDVLKLEFQQFNQVIVLNQGRFSEFLTSSFSDRKKILEELLGHKELRDLSKKLRAKRVALDSEVKSLKEQSEQAQLLEPQELEDKQHHLELTKLLKDSLDVKHKLTKEIANELKELIALTLKESQHEKSIESQKGKAKEIEEELDILTKTYKAHSLTLNELKEKYKDRKPILEEARKNKVAIDKEQQSLRHALASAKETQTTLEQNSTYLEKQKKKKTDLEKSIKEETSKLLFLKDHDLDIGKKAHQQLLDLKELKTLRMAHHKNIETYERDKEAIEATGAEFKSQKTELLELSTTISKQSKFESFDELCIQLESFIEAEKELNKIFLKKKDTLLLTDQKLDSITKKIQQSKEQKEKLAKELSKIKLDLLEQAQQKKSISEEAKCLEEKITQFNLLLSAKEIIEQNSDKPSSDCPVCQHSLSKKQWIETFESSLPKDQDRTKELLKKSQEELGKVESLLAGLKASENLIGEQITLNSEETLKNLDEQNKLNEEKKAITTYIENHEVDSSENLQRKLDLSSSALRLQKDIAIERRNWKTIEDKLNEEKEKLNQINKKEEELHQSILSMKVVAKDYRIDSALKSISEEIDTIHTIQRTQDTFEEVLKAFKKASQDLAENQKRLVSQNELIHTHNQNLTKLENEKAAKNYPLEPSKEVESFEIAIDKALKDVEKARRSKNERQTDFERNLSQINLLKEQIVEISILNTSYIEKLSSLIAPISSIKLDPSVDGPLERMSEYADAPLNRKSFKDSVSLWSDFLDEQLLPYSQNLEKEIGKASDTISTTKAQLDQNEKQNQKIKGLLLLRQELMAELDSLLKLEHYVGKDQFRDFTLAVLEENLLEVANAEIASLADGRYRLIHAKAGKGSEFLVQDYWQGGMKRKVSTLSGGETFLLSLGLSLGLCEISRGQTEIDCFFIDEGFGTLDSECIEQVLNCLMALQSRGKQIGLISHVKNLTDQIPVKIELSKNNFGESSLRLH